MKEDNTIPTPETPDADHQQPVGTDTSREDGRKTWSFGRMLQSVFDGTFLTRENVIRSIPYLFFLAFIGLVYIANTYYAEKTVRAIDHTKRELKELRYEHISVKSDLMYLSKQSEVSRRLESTGLKPTTSPPAKIISPRESTDQKDEE